MEVKTNWKAEAGQCNKLARSIHFLWVNVWNGHRYHRNLQATAFRRSFEQNRQDILLDKDSFLFCHCPLVIVLTLGLQPLVHNSLRLHR